MYQILERLHMRSIRAFTTLWHRSRSRLIYVQTSCGKTKFAYSRLRGDPVLRSRKMADISDISADTPTPTIFRRNTYTLQRKCDTAYAFLNCMISQTLVLSATRATVDAMLGKRG